MSQIPTPLTDQEEQDIANAIDQVAEEISIPAAATKPDAVES